MLNFEPMLTSLLINATRLTLALTPLAPDLVPEGWHVNEGQLQCTYELANFVESVAFVEQLVAPAEARGHHPDIVITYNRVSLSLTTHDAGGLTPLDFQLAEDIDEIAARHRPPLSCVPSED